MFNLSPITTSDIIQIVYVLVSLVLLFATIKCVIFSNKQVNTAIAGLYQSQVQFDIQNRANIVADIEYKSTLACLSVKNIGHQVAENVKIVLPENYLAIDMGNNHKFIREVQESFLSVTRPIPPGKTIEFPMWFRDDYNKLTVLDVLEINIEYCCNGDKFFYEFKWPVNDDFMIFNTPLEQQVKILEKIACSLEKIRLQETQIAKSMRNVKMQSEQENKGDNNADA